MRSTTYASGHNEAGFYLRKVLPVPASCGASELAELIDYGGT